VQPGDVAKLGLTGIPPDDVPTDAVQAVLPEALQGGITGVVWRDFKPGGGTPGEVEPGELGLPGVTVELRDSQGDTIDDTTTETNGDFAFDKVESGDYHIAVGSTTFAEPFGGVNWLGEKLITPAIMFAFPKSRFPMRIASCLSASVNSSVSASVAVSNAHEIIRRSERRSRRRLGTR